MTEASSGRCRNPAAARRTASSRLASGGALRSTTTTADSTLGFGRNTCGTYPERQAGGAIESHYHTRQAVLLGAAPGRQPLRDLSLHHHDAPLQTGRPAEEIQEYRGSDLVWQVRDQHPPVPGPELREVHTRPVPETDVDFQVFQGLCDHRPQTPVDLEPGDREPGLGQGPGERSCSDPDLERPGPGRVSGQTNDLGNDVGIGQEVLPQPLARPYPVPRQQPPDLGPRLAHSPNTEAARSLVSRATSITSMPQTWARAAPTRGT